ALAATGPQTLLHGDPHPGNTYALAGGRTGFYDWQLIRTGNWSHDVGYFLVSSLDVASRREHERELLGGYLAALRGYGVAAPDAAGAWERYRASPAYGLGAWLHTFSAGSFQPESVCVATLERFAAAYDDLETARAQALAWPQRAG
ncbi:MAG: phosphotransferase, partial [Solirubrobacteraceae bacterium]